MAISILLVCDLILNLLPALVSFGDGKRFNYGLNPAETDDQVFGRRIVCQPDVRFGRMRVGRTWMGVVDRQQALAPFTHLALCRKQIFRGGFVGRLGVRSDVAQAVESDRFCVRDSANQPAALLRRRFASMSDHRLNMFAPELNRWHGQSETTRRCSSSNCF